MENWKARLSPRAEFSTSAKTPTSIVVHGTVTGNITVSERCELKSTSELNGDLKATRIVIEEGAIFVGKSEVTPKSKADRAGTPATQDLSRKILPVPVTA
jgi:cytoskeletal protein CcmA (bactofilin family)